MATKLQSVANVLDEMDERETWRKALIAFYRVEFLKERADGLSRGEAMDHLDERMIEALKAAIPFAPVPA